ncbi:hypothetical protein BGX24_003437, partial [Mortierella sp. AD032]
MYQVPRVTYNTDTYLVAQVVAHGEPFPFEILPLEPLAPLAPLAPLDPLTPLPPPEAPLPIQEQIQAIDINAIEDNQDQDQNQAEDEEMMDAGVNELGVE